MLDAYLTGEGQSQDLGVDGKSYVDQVKVTGDVAFTAADKVLVNNLNVAAPTGQEKLLLIEVAGQSDGKFLLEKRVAKGGYEYLLNQHADGSWYLESAYDPNVPDNPDSPNNPPVTKDPVLRPEVGSYLANASMANNLFVHRLEERIAASQYTNQEKAGNVGQLWLRTAGGTHQFKEHGSRQIKTDGHHYLLHAGVDLAQLGQQQQLILGVMAALGNAEADSKSKVTGYKSSSKVHGYGLGGYATWYATPGDANSAYIDSWLMWSKFQNKVEGNNLGTERYNSSGILASLEAGKSFAVSQSATGVKYWLQPQAQLVYQGVDWNTFNEDSTQTRVKSKGPNLQTRLGTKLYAEVMDKQTAAISYRPFVAVNWIHNSQREQIALDGQNYGVAGGRNLAELKLGLEGQTSKDSYVWVNASYQQGSHGLRNLTGHLGWKTSF